MSLFSGRKVKVRPMELTDLDAVMAIEQLCFAVPWSRESYQKELTENKCACYVVITENGQVAGYAGMWLVIDEAHVTNVAVHPAFRGRGYGEQLMRALMREAAQYEIQGMTLEVRRGNLIAQNLYTKLGFEKSGFRKGYYSDNHEDALVMWNQHL